MTSHDVIGVYLKLHAYIQRAMIVVVEYLDISHKSKVSTNELLFM